MDIIRKLFLLGDIAQCLPVVSKTLSDIGIDVRHLCPIALAKQTVAPLPDLEGLLLAVGIFSLLEPQVVLIGNLLFQGISARFG